MSLIKYSAEVDCKVNDALQFFGMDAYREIDYCEDGSVYVGLIQILPKGSIDYERYTKYLDTLTTLSNPFYSEPQRNRNYDD